MKLAAAWLACTGCTYAVYTRGGDEYTFIISCFECLFLNSGNKILGTASR